MIAEVTNIETSHEFCMIMREHGWIEGRLWRSKIQMGLDVAGLKGGRRRKCGRVENWTLCVYSVVGKLVSSIVMFRANVAANPVKMDAETRREFGEVSGYFARDDIGSR